MGLITSEIYTDDYDYISMQTYCNACSSASHFAEIHETDFEIRLSKEKKLLNNPIDVDVESAGDLNTAFCYFLAKNIHLNMIKITFNDRIARFTFTPDATYAPVTQITCVGINNYGARYETQTLVSFEQLPVNVSDQS